MADIIRQAIVHEGFSVVEIMTQCPTYFGRKNKQGIFVQIDKPEYCAEYDRIIERARGGE